MATTTTTSARPVINAKETLLGVISSLQQRFGLAPTYDVSTTLNTKLGIFPNRTPTGQIVLGYFVIGVGGAHPDADGRVSAQYVAGTNMAPYDLLPFRIVLEDQDLSPTERANYALRRVEEHNGERYVAYYAKKIVLTSSVVELVRTDPLTGAVSTYEINPADLSPTPPETDSNGVVVDISDQITAAVPGTITITGAEVLEAISVLHNGDQRWANISEIGFVTGSPEVVDAVDAAQVPFQYTELLYAQMVDHMTSSGQPYPSAENVVTKNLRFSASNVINT